MSANKGKRKCLDRESDEIYVSRFFKLVSCKTNHLDLVFSKNEEYSGYGDEEENSTDHTKGGYFEKEYCDEGWFIGWRYKGDKASYVCREDTDDEEDDEECNGSVKANDYSDEESIN
ncbi:hypothetical protein Tco_0606624 [Tanacetum coccineum]